MVTSETDSQILVEQKNNILMLGINRPEKKNALTRAMYDTLRTQMIAAKTDPEIKAVLIYGKNNIFCAGNDLVDFNNRPSGVPSPAQLFLTMLHEFEKPIVGAVSGVAIGIGVTMLMHFDLVYAASDARFRMPFVNLGVIPEGASSLLLPANVGYKKAANALLLGDFFTTQDAIELGVVTQKVKERFLFDHAIEKATQLTQKPAQALLLTKQLLKQSLQHTVLERIDHECQLFEKMLLTPESIAARNAINPAGKKSGPKKKSNDHGK